MLSDSSSPEFTCSPVHRRKFKRHQVSSSESSDDDSPVRRPVRGTRSRVPSSSSSSSSDQPRKKRTRRSVLDSETSDSSDSYESDGPTLPFRKESSRCALQSESDSYASEIEAALGTTFLPKDSKNDGSSSDSDGAEHCIICFKTLQHPVARPSGCSHIFHENCLSTWSKTSNTCPIDRVKYNCINIVNGDGNVLHSRIVTTPTPCTHSDVEPSNPTFCEICHFHDREEVMLLCDRCDAGYHIDCLDPPLDTIPSGQWFCPSCELTSIEDSEVLELLADNVLLESRLRSRPQMPARLNPRLHLSRRAVQAALNLASNATQVSTPANDEPSTSTGRRGTSGKRPRTRRKNSRRKRTTKYKVELVTTEDGTTVEVKLAIHSRRHKKKKKKKPSKSSKKYSGGRCEGEAGSSHGPQSNFHPAPLDLFGSRPILDYFSGCEAEDEEEIAGEVGMLRAGRSSLASRSGLVSRKGVAQMLATTPPTQRPRVNIEAPVSSTNVLDSILRDQELWHHPGPSSISSSSDGAIRVTLPKDGSGCKPRENAIHGGRNDGHGGGGHYRGRGGPSRGGRMSGGNRNATGMSGGNRSATGMSGGSGNGGASTSASGTSSGGTSGSSSYQASSSSYSSVIQPIPAPPMPPLCPPPEPPLKLCEDDDLDLYGDIEPPSVISRLQKGDRHKAGRKSTQNSR